MVDNPKIEELRVKREASHAGGGEKTGSSATRQRTQYSL